MDKRYNAESYKILFDSLLSQELLYSASAATEHNIKKAMKHILGLSIRQGLIKGYSNLVLSEELNVYFTITDSENNNYSLILYYGQ